MSRSVGGTMLVTGGAGYIGSHVCKALRLAGLLPVTYDNLSRGHRSAVKWGPIEEGDIRDRDRLAAVLARYRPEAVMHLAALTNVGESVTLADLYREVNVGGTETLLDAMHRAGVLRLVYASSAAVYGAALAGTARDEPESAPTNPYGETKALAEAAIREAGSNWGLSWVSLRCFNVAGADPEGETGESHEPETHLVPLVLKVARGEKTEFEIFGGDYDTPDGTCLRDYIHVSDVAEAHVLAQAAIADGLPSCTVDIGTGRGRSVREVVAAAREATKKEIPFVIRPKRPGDVPQLIANAASAGRALAWTPAHSDLEIILKTAWEWGGRQG